MSASADPFAQSYLHRKYQFVPLECSTSYQFYGALLAFDVPIISGPLLGLAAKSYVLSIRAEVRSLHLRPVQTHTVYLLALDLGALCEMLQMLALPTSSRFVSVSGPRGAIPRPVLQSDDNSTLDLEIKVRQTRISSFKAKDQITLLHELRVIKGSGVYASFLGFADEHALRINPEQVALQMRPSLVWIRVREWAIFDAILHRKRQADVLASSSSRRDLAQAQAIYPTIGEVLRNALMHLDPELGVEDAAYVRVKDLLMLLEDDLHLSGVHFCMRAQMFEVATYFLTTKEVTIFDRPRPIVLHFLRLALALAVLSELKGIRSLYKIGQILPLMNTFPPHDPV